MQTTAKTSSSQQDYFPKDILISVIMPVFNTGQWFDESYQSVLTQAIDFEILVVDDGSVNDTFEILSAFAKADERIRLYRNESNRGVAYSRNLALENARGDYLAFLDCGDVWLPGKLSAQITSMTATGSQLSYSGYQYFDSDMQRVIRTYRVPATVSYRDLLKENCLGCSTVLIKRQPQVLHFDEAFFHEDYVLWLSLLKRGVRFVGLPDVTTKYRVGGRSQNKSKAARNRWRVLRQSEQLNLLSSSYYFMNYALRSTAKYLRRR